MTTPEGPNRSYLPAAVAVVFLLAAGWFAFQALGSPDPLTASSSTSITTDQTSVPNSAPPPSTATASTTTLSSTSPTTSATSSTTEVSIDGSTTTTTTIRVDTSGNVGWYVTGVAAGDVLNVRAAPTVNSEIVGILRPNQDDVSVLPIAANPIGETAWYGVRLPSGTDGFVNSRYLAHPNTWDAGLRTTACTAQTSTGSQTATTPADGDATTVVGLFQFQTATCSRYVIVLGNSTGGSYSSAEILGGGDVIVTSEKTRVTVILPDTIVDVVPQATNSDFNLALAMTVVPVERPDGLEVRFLHQTGRIAGITVLSNPARIVIDVAEAPIGEGLNFRPIVETGNTVLEHPVDQSTDNVGVRGGFTLTGYARWFESQGYAELKTRNDEDPDSITWSGPSLYASEGGFAAVTAPHQPTWGEFILSAAVAPGKYRLFIGDDCMNAVDDTIRPCGVTESFEILP